MAFDRPTLSELQERIIADIETRLGIAGAGLRRSFTKLFGTALAGLAHLLHGHLIWVSKQLFVTTAEGEYLDRHGSKYGITREAATYAEGEVTFTGTNGTAIAEETELVSSDGVRFKTTEAAVIAAGVAVVPVIALAAGVDGNAEDAAILSLSSPISGVESEAEVTSEILGGADEESDEDYRDRILEYIQLPPLGGALQDYVLWAKEIAGVTRAWAYENYNGAGTVGVFFVRDEDVTIYPSNAEISAVSAHIQEERPVGVRAYVYSPSADVLNFNISIDPDTATIRAAIEAELEDLVEREAEPGGTILLSHMREAISLAADEDDHTLVSPTANFVSSNGYMAEFGTITWS